MGQDEGLALYLDLGMTRAKYHLLTNNAKEHNASIYPSYPDIVRAMERCLPEKIDVDEKQSEVKLQVLLAHVSQRLAILQHEVIMAAAQSNEGNTFALKLIKVTRVC